MGAALMMANELEEVADIIWRNPELMLPPDPFDSAQRMAMGLDAMDLGLL